VIDGLDTGEFQPAFQGIYHEQRAELVRTEAPIRWRHPGYGRMLPDAFIATLEHPDVAWQMTRFVIEEACRQMHDRDLPRCSPQARPMSINVPPGVLADEAFAPRLLRTLRAHGIAPSRVELEPVESGDASHLLAAKHVTRPLRNAGVRLALDDVGTVYSSLAAHAAFDIDTVKFARDLVSPIPSSQRSATVLASTLSMLEQLGLQVVVEGIETEAQWEVARAMAECAGARLPVRVAGVRTGSGAAAAAQCTRGRSSSIRPSSENAIPGNSCSFLTTVLLR
jgi:EAL domain-containing protein (putative c-di-GMP-specific phosphodiesterase class I)